MAEESLFQRQFNYMADLKNNPAMEGIMSAFGSAPEAVSAIADMKDRTVPANIGDALIQQGINIIPNIAIGAEKTADALKNLLESDSSLVRGLKDGTILEQDLLDSGYDFRGLDLVDILGPNFGDSSIQNLTLPDGTPAFDKVGPGQSNIFDPTGEGLFKDQNEEIQYLLDNADEAANFGYLDVTQFDVEQEEKREAAAKKFRLQEEELVNSQGGLGSMTVAESDKIKKESIELTQKDAEAGFMAAMDDFFEGARGTGPEMPKKRTIEQYKEAFSEATGIDVSGKVDKKAFLMSIGLGLLQNKAGKNFDISKIAEETGRVIEEALPALEKAKESARQGALAGGKFALQTESADKAVRAAAEEKMLNRDRYWVFKKGTADKPFEGFDVGQFESLNKYELDKLMKDPKFQEQFDFISYEDRFEILKAKVEAENIDYGDQWSNDLKQVSLIGGLATDLPPALQVAAVAEDSNFKGKSTSKYKLQEGEEGVKRRLVDFQKEIIKNEEVLSELIKNIQEGISIPEQFIGKVKQIGISFGLDLDTSSTAAAQKELANVAIDNVLAILKESGRTISEGERKRAEQRVGEVKMSLYGSDPKLVLKQVEYVYNMVVGNAQKKLDTAVSGFEENFGFEIIPSNPSNSKQSPITKTELNEFNTMYGTDFTMETFPKD